MPMSETLRHLITEAVALGGENLCVNSHDWQSVGGRACPFRDTEQDCEGSQTVYQCARCGEYDYGYRGGLAYEECCAHHRPPSPGDRA